FVPLVIRALASYGLLGIAAIASWQLPRAWESGVDPGAGQGARDPVREVLQGAIVVLDAGHGGEDGGTSGHGIQEKDLAFDLARRVERRLVAHGVQVRMTRDADTFVELGERSALARRVGACVFVSLHLNASSAPEVMGIETYFS